MIAFPEQFKPDLRYPPDRVNYPCSFVEVDGKTLKLERAVEKHHFREKHNREP